MTGRSSRKMEIYWSFILCLGAIHISTATLFGTHKPFQLPKPGGILDFITKPKLPLPSFQIGTHIGGGSFGFGFDFGLGGQGSQGGYVPPNERDHAKPPPSWEEEEEEVKERPQPGPEEGKKEIGPRPNAGDEEKKKLPKPDSFGETAKEKYPDWEDIGEDDRKSEELLAGDLVADGLIQPRVPRSKRFIESRVYHVPLQFRSNAKPFQVKFRSSSNSLEKGNSGM